MCRRDEIRDIPTAKRGGTRWHSEIRMKINGMDKYANRMRRRAGMQQSRDIEIFEVEKAGGEIRKGDRVIFDLTRLREGALWTSER